MEARKLNGPSPVGRMTNSAVFSFPTMSRSMSSVSVRFSTSSRSNAFSLTITEIRMLCSVLAAPVLNSS